MGKVAEDANRLGGPQTVMALVAGSSALDLMSACCRRSWVAVRAVTASVKTGRGLQAGAVVAGGTSAKAKSALGSVAAPCCDMYPHLSRVDFAYDKKVFIAAGVISS